jgi:DNA-binding NarL/FixJ family response regulator
VIRVLLADDQELVRSGFRLILELAEGIEVAGEAANGREAVLLAKELQPDVVLMDVRMPELDGIEATRRLRQAGVEARVLVLTTFDLDEYVYAALRAGASGFLLKDAPREQLVTAVRTVARGEALLAPAVTQRLIERFVTRPAPAEAAPALAELSARELDVLHLLARGLSNAEIAAQLIIGEATVKTHVARILRKLALRDRVQAVVYAYESGVIEPGSTAVQRDSLA